MLHKVSELEGALLDAAVAKAEGATDVRIEDWGEGPWCVTSLNAFEPVPFRPSSKWQDGGPIIERERIGVWSGVEPYSGEPAAGLWYAEGAGTASNRAKSSGPTPLIAAMRAYVTSKLGTEVEL